MAKFIKLTDHSTAGGIDIYVNSDVIFSLHRPQGTEMTIVSSLVSTEQVKEAPEEILALIDRASMKTMPVS